MRPTICLLITAILAIGGSLLLDISNPTLSTAYSFALGSITTGVVLTLIVTRLQSSYPSGAGVVHSKTIYVGNLPYRANEADVKELFSQHGEVFAVRLMKDKRTGKRRGFGFVVMAAEQAPTAIENLNNSEYGDRTLKVREANDPRKTARA
ncbi:RNA recognition motif domain-containing protein [Veronia pacifica]|uniref:RNA-binding protein n=1 Tax=Veronia pacifica TaxID=1080227 RepID=A0A1C3EJR3_9GAMM|nr:RNA-binding protein [Veronia pacifica]ODA33476.1 RNA-binding protein [Veronia pacifica]